MTTTESSSRSSTIYRVQASGEPGGNGHIRCFGADIRADTGSSSQGVHPGPAELLCASLAACLLKNIERFSELLPFDYQAAVVDVEAERQDSPPRMIQMRYRVEIVTDEPQRRLELLHRNIRKFGTITNTLAAACEVTGEMVVSQDRDSEDGRMTP